MKSLPLSNAATPRAALLACTTRTPVQTVASSFNAYLIAVVGNYVVTFVNSRLGLGGAAAFAFATAQVAAENVQLAQLLVLYPEHDVPDVAERDAVVQTLRLFDSKIGARAIVHVGGSLKAGLTRVLLSTAHLMRSRRYPTSSFDDIRSAAVWLESRLPAECSSSGGDLRAVLGELQRTVEEGRGAI